MISYNGWVIILWLHYYTDSLYEHNFSYDTGFAAFYTQL